MTNFVFNFYLVVLVGQVFCEEPTTATLTELPDDELAVGEFNETGNDFLPQPRFLQVRTNEKSYTFNLLPVNWHTARELCTAQNQVIASIRSPQESNNVMIALRRYGAYYFDTTFWIGGSQLGHIGQWSWVRTGQPFTYTNWQSNQEPENYWNRDCVELLGNGIWNSNDCNLKRPVICEDLPSSCYEFN